MSNLTGAEKTAADNLLLELGARAAEKRTDLVKAQFIGRDSDNKLMQFAPGNYKKNEVVMIPIDQLKFRWWKLVE